MLKSFQCNDTKALFNDLPVARFKTMERPARRKLLYLHRARSLQDLMPRVTDCNS
jgi:proteic killer suppression protein